MTTTIGASRLSRRTLLQGTAALGLASCTGALPRGDATGQKLYQPPEVRSVNGVLSTELYVRYSEYRLAGKPVKLRGYDGLPVGRTLRVKAGDKLNVRLKNVLPLEFPGETCGGNQPHAFNTTNLHVHGVHVSPSQPSDYILLALASHETAKLYPKTQWQYPYSYDIPADHPPGTYFYHSHYHGSVALQVASGMAGALIIEGEVDAIKEIRDAKEQVVVFQSQRVDARGECDDYALLEPTGGRTYVNGQRQPYVTMRPGEVQRWRLVNGTHIQHLNLAWPGCEVVVLCRDGNPLPNALVLNDPLRLVPGNRADVLIKAPQKAGTYVVEGSGDTLMTIVVEGSAVSMPLFSGALPSYSALQPIEKVDYGRRLLFGMTGAPPHVTYTINNVPFSCENPWKIPLGSAEEWEITNQTNDIHPFHIHTNPFQLLEGGNAPPGTWLDTVEIPPAHKVRFRTKFRDFKGTLVFHCHTLTHEDMGMMQAVEIV